VFAIFKGTHVILLSGEVPETHFDLLGMSPGTFLLQTWSDRFRRTILVDTYERPQYSEVEDVDMAKHCGCRANVKEHDGKNCKGGNKVDNIDASWNATALNPAWTQTSTAAQGKIVGTTMCKGYETSSI
jgi:hypothetical protein